jgi:xanthine dehydrogenase YagS FAD-binding subunit
MHLTYKSPDSLDQAIELIGGPGTRIVGGGTDLLVAMESGLDPTSVLVDITKAAGADSIVEQPDGGLRVGAAARLDAVTSHAAIRSRFPVLALAAEAVATPAIRSMGTIGGNLCQRPRCWYLRQRIPCHKNGGTGCPALDGENQYHAILGGGPCHAAHPSDLAVALLALDARVLVRSAKGTRTISIDELYANAATDARSETTLAAGELIEAIELPATSAGGTQRFTKLMQRGVWDFALVSLAACKRTDGTVRLALGGVAPKPWLVNPSVGEDISSGALDEDSADALSARAFHDAKPLEMNGYKVQQATALLKRAMMELSRA